MSQDYVDENLLLLSLEIRRKDKELASKEELIESLTKLIEHLRNPEVTIGDFCYQLTTEDSNGFSYHSGKVCTPEALFSFTKGNLIYLDKHGADIHELEELSRTLSKLAN